MPLIDYTAAGRIRDMREDRGLSPEALSAEIKTYTAAQGWGNRGAVDAHTIRRIEHHGHVPGTRVAFVIASYFGMRPSELWVARNAHRQAVAA